MSFPLPVPRTAAALALKNTRARGPRHKVSFLLLLVAAFADLPAGEHAILPKWQFVFAGEDTSDRYAHRDLDDSIGRAVTLPHTFNPCSSYEAHRTGIGWYTTEVTIPRNKRKSDLRLRFGGACLRSRVFLNGEETRRNDLAYLPFEVEIPRYAVKRGRVRVSVAVDSRLRNEDIPDRHCNGWWLYGGLIRDVTLVAKPVPRIEDVALRTVHLAGDTFDLGVSFTQVGTPADSVRIVVRDSAGAPMLGAVLRGSATRVGHTLRCNGVRPWTPRDPCLHTVELIPFYNGRPGAALRFKRGFCQLTSRKWKFFLNGRPVILRGVGRHDVRGGRGPLLSREQRREDLLDIKKLNANFVRIAHFPQSSDVYELCDSLGLLVMDEIPAWKTGSAFLSSEKGRDIGRRYIHRLIREHGNHTCIALWSLGNEFQSCRSLVADFVQSTASYARNLDPTRLVTFAGYFYQFDKAYEHVDVISINEYFGWFLGSLDMLAPMMAGVHKQWPDKPILISEFGAAAEAGKRNPDAQLAGNLRSVFTKDFSEDHQALYVKSHIKEMWFYNQLCKGMVVWAYNDFMEPRRKPRSKDTPPGLNTMGLVTQDRRRKMSWNVVRERYGVIAEEMKKKGGY